MVDKSPENGRPLNFQHMDHDTDDLLEIDLRTNPHMEHCDGYTVTYTKCKKNGVWTACGAKNNWDRAAVTSQGFRFEINKVQFSRQHADNELTHLKQLLQHVFERGKLAKAEEIRKIIGLI